MKNKRLITFYVVLFALFTFFPKLAAIPFSSYLPKIILFILLIYICYIQKTKIFRLDSIILILLLYAFSLFISYLSSSNKFILNNLLYSIFFILMLEAGVSLSAYLKSNSIIKITGYNFYIILCLFLALPLSVIIQYFYSEIAYYYYQVVIYDEVLNDNFQAIDGKFSGLTGGVGTGGSTALATLFVLFETIRYYFFDASKFYHLFILTLVRTVYLIAIVMCGTAGLILVVIYFFARYLLSASKILKNAWKLILFFAIFYIILFLILPMTEIQGISYFKVLNEEGFDGFLMHRSMGSLIGQYADLLDNYDRVIDNAGLFGNANAIGYYDVTDIGFLNEINLFGLCGFIFFNVYLFLSLIIGLKKYKNTFFCKTDYALRCALVSISLYSFILQIKEFSSIQGNGPQALALLLLIVLFGIRKTTQ